MMDRNSRFIELQGCINFRDLGGYRTGDGKAVRWRRLFRSDSVHLMTAQDTDYVYDSLGVVTLFDLRNSDEVRRDASAARRPASVQYHHVPFLEHHGIAPFNPEEDPADRLAGIYLWVLGNSGSLVADVVNRLAREPQLFPALFHCTAGKDRTGVLAALLLGVLGVDNETILADYALTNQTMDRLYERLRAIPGNEERPISSFEAQPKAMEEVLATLTTEYGGAEGYLTSHGVTADSIDRLRASLLD